MTEDAGRILDDVQRRVTDDFASVRRILSFEEYIDAVATDPASHLRTAAQYVVDAFDHFGRESRTCGGRTVERFRLFDGVEDGPFLAGHEDVQAAIYRELASFAESGRVDKLLLLHGPNGSAKSTIAQLIALAMERYSQTDAGALYRFYWVFPRPQSHDEQRLGFAGGRTEGSAPETFAFLPPEDLAARLPCELRDPPFFLVPPDERRAFVDRVTDALPAGAAGRLRNPRVLDGDLSPKSKAIYEGLLASYHGDWRRVMAHVQVERFFVSRRFRCGAVTIDPQLHVDATARQVTADRSTDYLPPALHNLGLIEPGGDLVDANRGLVEFGDFLKRPVDMNKYLLQTVETGTVSLGSLLLHLDLVFLGSTNENHLDAFKKSIDFTSFKARMELVQVPYLLRLADELRIYDGVTAAIGRRKPVAPHTARVAALWAILTRLQKPHHQSYPDDVAPTIEKLTPLEKAKLYDTGEAPAWLNDEGRKRLRRVLPRLRREFRDAVYYEGRFGASPREVRGILHDASHRSDHPCLSPLAVLATLEEFVLEKHVYDFLQLEPNGTYNDNEGFIGVVRDEYHAWVTAELEGAMELIDEGEYERQCTGYFSHVIAFTRGETVLDERTGRALPASEDTMGAVERLLDIHEPAEVFRKNLVARIGAFRVDNPDAPVVYRELFPDIFGALRQDFFSKRRDQIERVEQALIEWEDAPPSDAKLRARAERTMRNMRETYGYPEEALREVILFVRKHRRLDR